MFILNVYDVLDILTKSFPGEQLFVRWENLLWPTYHNEIKFNIVRL